MESGIDKVCCHGLMATLAELISSMAGIVGRKIACCQTIITADILIKESIWQR